MRRGRRLAPLLVLIAAFSIGGAETGSNVAAAPSPMPLISRGVPVYASSQIYPATYANDSSYGTNWRGTIPGWIALDLSRVPAAQRHQAIVAWYNDPATSPYDHTVVGDVAYNNLRDYTVDANAAPGGGGSPDERLGHARDRHRQPLPLAVPSRGPNGLQLGPAEHHGRRRFFRQ